MQADVGSIERLKKLRGVIDWCNVNDVEIRLAFHILQEYGELFAQEITVIVDEMAKRNINGGFSITDEVPVFRGDVPSWFYKWPFCMLWKQHPNNIRKE